jgi:phosphohistidine phosphatase
MSRELWLLRHAKAETNANIDDFDRNLKKRGKHAAKRIGLWMKQQQFRPDLVLSSPALRAISTTRLVCPYIGIAEQDILQDGRLYFADKGRLKSVLAESAGQAQRVLLVGHNPGLEELLIDLAASIPEMDKLMPTSAFVRLDMPDHWQNLTSGCAELVSITHAKALMEGD